MLKGKLTSAFDAAVAESNRCFEAEDFRGAELYHDIAAAIDLALRRRPPQQAHQLELVRDLEPCGA